MRGLARYCYHSSKVIVENTEERRVTEDGSRTRSKDLLKSRGFVGGDMKKASKFPGWDRNVRGRIS
jgi:hypothetical protein